ncbi:MULTISPECIES: hypothetical protein [unclassified Mesorhizobium]|nr:hypothetical protein [Mesorhizobium sp. LSHC420B00]
MTIRTVLIASFLIVSTLYAHAQEIPRYDPAGYGKDVSDVSGGSAMIYNGCMKMEQEAYDDLRPVWSGVPSQTRSYCDEVANVSGSSYSILKGCVEMEANASASRPEFKF